MARATYTPATTDRPIIAFVVYVRREVSWARAWRLSNESDTPHAAFSTRKLHKRLHPGPQKPPRRLNTYQKCTFCRAFAPQPSYVAPQRTPLQQPPRVSLHIQVKKAAPCAAPRGPAEPPGGPPLHGRGWLHQAHPRERPSGPPAPGPHTFTTKPQRTLRPSRPRLDDAAQGPTDTLAQVSLVSPDARRLTHCAL